MRCHGPHPVATVMLLVACGLASPDAWGQSGDEVRRAVAEALADDGALRRIDVSVEGADVTLAGAVDTLWVKLEALRRAGRVPGVGRIVSELDIPAAENDRRLADAVGRTIRDYPDHTIWDFIGAVIDDGVVALSGRVTPERDKAADIFERVAKLRGVQDIENGIRPLPASVQDDRLRRAIAGRLFRSPLFMRFGSMRSPPFRIIVENSTVTLLGFVPSDVERSYMAEIVADTPGVVRVVNQLQVSG